MQRMQSVGRKPSGHPAAQKRGNRSEEVVEGHRGKAGGKSMVEGYRGKDRREINF